MCRAILVSKPLDWILLSHMMMSSSFTNRLLADLMTDFMESIDASEDEAEYDSDKIEFKYTEVLHTIRMRARKLLQFSK